jgi:L-2-hydroxyglutarate oxidase LhgO
MAQGAWRLPGCGRISPCTLLDAPLRGGHNGRVGETTRADVAVVGGGLVGLATALRLLERRAGRVVVVEKEREVAVHQSGHNSGVIHSGIYYVPGSLKARLCVAGVRQLIAFCDRHDVPYRLDGKVIVATHERELDRLGELHRRGVENGVPGLRAIGPRELERLEPAARGVRALWSPNTGIIDFRDVARALAAEIGRLGGEILLDHEVRGVRRAGARTSLETTGGDVEATTVVACAGVHADRFAVLAGVAPEPRIVPFRGNYWLLAPERRDLVRANIYPVPDPAFPFLGVHFTRRMDGEVWLGPSAVPALGREAYGRREIVPRDVVETLRHPGMRRLAARYWRMGSVEMARDLSRRLTWRALRRYVPEIRLDDVRPGPAGIRAQALGDDGALVDDFLVDRRDGVVVVRNAPSPAATSCLAIGDLIADQV